MDKIQSGSIERYNSVSDLLLNNECYLYTKNEDDYLSVFPTSILNINAENGIITGTIRIDDINKFISLQIYHNIDTKGNFVDISNIIHTYSQRSKSSNMTLKVKDFKFYHVAVNRLTDNTFKFMAQVPIELINIMKGGSNGETDTRLIKGRS